MGRAYLIACPEKTTWEIDLDYLANQLKGKWPHLIITKSSDITLLAWGESNSSSTLGYNIIGEVLSDKKTVALVDDMNLDACANFAVWYRKLIPATEKLVFCDDGYYKHIDLNIDTTEEEIIQAMQDDV